MHMLWYIDFTLVSGALDSVRSIFCGMMNFNDQLVSGEIVAGSLQTEHGRCTPGQITL